MSSGVEAIAMKQGKYQLNDMYLRACAISLKCNLGRFQFKVISMRQCIYIFFSFRVHVERNAL